MRTDIVHTHADVRTVDIEVVPIKRQPQSDIHFLVVFRPSLIAPLPETLSPHTEKGHGSREIISLKRELATANEHLRHALEDEQNAREEFQSVNEEIVSSNEELQSTNEELETAKEELQSTNEELVTVNEELQTRNHELTQTNNDLANVLSSANVPIIIVDRELRIRRITPTAEKSFRIIPSDIGRPLTDINLPIKFPGLQTILRDVIEKVEPQHLEVKDDDSRWFTLWVRPYQTWDKKIDGAVITFIDVNEIKEVQAELVASLSYAEGILGTMRESLLILDKNLRVKSANKAFYLTFDISEKDTVGKRIYDMGQGLWNKPQLREALEDILPTRSSFHDLEITLEISDFETRILSMNGQRLLQRDGKEELILLAMEDITAHRVLQERNDTFVSMASHELKTPVTTVKALVQILQKRFEASSDKMLIEYLSRMGQQIEQLASLVNDFLDISKIRSGRFNINTDVVDIDDLTREIVENYQLLSSTHTIQVRGETHTTVNGDRDRLGQVLINLVVNAIKYSPKASKIVVTRTKTSNEVIVSVQDFGIGISKRHQKKIFERFFQIGNKVGQNFSGLGIGLYISHDIVTRHGGKIWVESNGKGSTFSFSLPIHSLKKESERK